MAIASTQSLTIPCNLHLLTSAVNSILDITHEPVQITGRYYGLVRFGRSMQPDGDLFLAIHFDRDSRQFTGAEEIVRLPQVVPNLNDTAASTSRNIETSVLNEAGWYIYGAVDRSGQFVVQAIAPRSLLQVEADRQDRSQVLGSTLEDRPLQQIAGSLLSWRTILPRLTSDEVTQIFLKQGGSAQMLRTNQVGGTDPDIAPIAPMTL